MPQDITDEDWKATFLNLSLKQLIKATLTNRAVKQIDHWYGPVRKFQCSHQVFKYLNQFVRNQGIFCIWFTNKRGLNLLDKLFTTYSPFSSIPNQNLSSYSVLTLQCSTGRRKADTLQCQPFHPFYEMLICGPSYQSPVNIQESHIVSHKWYLLKIDKSVLLNVLSQ